MINHSVVMIAGVLPTIGHEALIEFAANVSSCVTVILPIRSHEPFLKEKKMAFGIICNHYRNVRFAFHHDDDAPQDPNPLLENDVEFWSYWKNVVEEITYDKWGYEPTHFIASEEYGLNMASVLDIDFIPYDINRTIVNVRGTDVRKDINKSWNMISKSMRKQLMFNIVFVGQESVGKTTIANNVSKWIDNSVLYPEYARPYLETVGSDLTPEKMQNIATCQETLDCTWHGEMVSIRDTNLLSTYGYLLLHPELDTWDETFLGFGSDSFTSDDTISNDIVGEIQSSRTLYILLPDDIPFEEDQLRYGGNERESTYQFWKDILVDLDLDFYEFPSGKTLSDKVELVITEIFKKINEISSPFNEYER